MSSEISLDEAKRLVQARLDSWRTPEREFFIASVTPFEHGWVMHRSAWLYDHGLKRKDTTVWVGGQGPFAVAKTGEVYSTPGFLRTEVVCELLARNWEATHAAALSVEMSEEARKVFFSFFNRMLHDIVHAGGVEVRLESDPAGFGIRWRSESEWHEYAERPFFIGALFVRRLKQMADIDPADLNEEGAMQSGLIKFKMRDVRYKMDGEEPVKQDGKLVTEARKAFYNVSLLAFPTARGEQIVLIIELDERTSTWSSDTSDWNEPF